MAIAIVVRPVGARASTTSCNIPQPCAVFANNTGSALEGESAGADGVLGEAASGTIYGAGIEGESLKQTGADAAGTFGLTLLSNGVAPLYGVYGQAGNTGLSSTGPGYGVFGQDNAGSNAGDFNAGVTGLSKNNVGVLAEGGGAPTSTLYGNFGIPIGLYAVAKNSNGNHMSESVGAFVESDSVGEIVENTTSGFDVSIAQSNGFAVEAGTTQGGRIFDIDTSGDEYLAGTLTTMGGKGGPYLRTTGASGKTVTAYADHTTAPEMDDVGEAQLVDGRAFVPIDAALADVIDLRSGYHVFITPEGDSKGLYVIKGSGGFFVREQQGGRSTLPFDYRIVAKPREENGTRLPRVTDVAQHVEPVTEIGLARPQRVPLPLSPEEHLKREIGTRAYAELMTTLSKRFASLRSH